MAFPLRELDERGTWRSGGGQNLPDAKQTKLPAFTPVNDEGALPVDDFPDDDMADDDDDADKDDDADDDGDADDKDDDATEDDDGKEDGSKKEDTPSEPAKPDDK